MMEWTDTHFRHLARLLSRNTWLYTEMVVDSTLCYNPDKLDRWLSFTTAQHPAVLQLGGSNVKLLAQAAKLSAAYGYDEINLNCGCPSPKVAGDGCFGASLMLRPALVADACAAMADASGMPVTVKCRIGVDDNDSYEELCAFVGEVSRRGGVRHFIIHARKALLNGLSPEENRRVPPLKYDVVRALARDFPGVRFSLNGGLLSLDSAVSELWPEGGGPGARGISAGFEAASTSSGGTGLHPDGRLLHGMMVGRAVWDRPWELLADADRRLWGAENPAVLEEYANYADDALRGQRFGPGYPTVRALMKPILNLFAGAPRSRNWKTLVDAELKTTGKKGKGDGVTVRSILERTLGILPEDVLDAPPPRSGTTLAVPVPRAHAAQEQQDEEQREQLQRQPPPRREEEAEHAAAAAA